MILTPRVVRNVEPLNTGGWWVFYTNCYLVLYKSINIIITVALWDCLRCNIFVTWMQREEFMVVRNYGIFVCREWFSTLLFDHVCFSQWLDETYWQTPGGETPRCQVSMVIYLVKIGWTVKHFSRHQVRNSNI